MGSLKPSKSTCSKNWNRTFTLQHRPIFGQDGNILTITPFYSWTLELVLETNSCYIITWMRVKRHSHHKNFRKKICDKNPAFWSWAVLQWTRWIWPMEKCTNHSTTNPQIQHCIYRMWRTPQVCDVSIGWWFLLKASDDKLHQSWKKLGKCPVN